MKWAMSAYAKLWVHKPPSAVREDSNSFSSGRPQRQYVSSLFKLENVVHAHQDLLAQGAEDPLPRMRLAEIRS